MLNQSVFANTLQNAIPVTAAKSEAQQLEELLRQKVKFVNPEDAFALYAFMNHTGYDYENHTSFHPVRKAIREEIAKKNIIIARPKYFIEMNQNYGGLESDMSTFIGWLGDAPNFKIEPEMERALGMYVTENLEDLDERLTEFYQKAGIRELYIKYQPEYEKAYMGQQDEMYKVLVKLTQHFNVKLQEARDFEIFVNLQDMYWRGYMFSRSNIDPNTTKPYLLQIGPDLNGRLNILNIAHEYSHVFVTPIIKGKPEQVRQLTVALTYEYGSPSNSFYTTWDKIVDESFVRAMDAWATEQGREHIQAQVNDGFIMTEYIYNRISDFEKNPQLKFEDWVIDVMGDYAEMIQPNLGSSQESYNKGYEEGYKKGWEEAWAEAYTKAYEEAMKNQ